MGYCETFRKLIKKQNFGSSFFPALANATKIFLMQVSFFICFCQISKIFLHKFSPKTRYDTEKKRKIDGGVLKTLIITKSSGTLRVGNPLHVRAVTLIYSTMEL